MRVKYHQRIRGSQVHQIGWRWPLRWRWNIGKAYRSSCRRGVSRSFQPMRRQIAASPQYSPSGCTLAPWFSPPRAEDGAVGVDVHHQGLGDDPVKAPAAEAAEVPNHRGRGRPEIHLKRPPAGCSCPSLAAAFSHPCPCSSPDVTPSSSRHTASLQTTRQGVSKPSASPALALKRVPLNRAAARRSPAFQGRSGISRAPTSM